MSGFRVRGGVLGVLAVAVVCIWSAAYAQANNSGLSVHFLDVGQGDAIFIESPTGTQMLIDGGPDRGVLRELADVMPWFDRSIDVILATHPDSDHIAGLIDVFDRYTIATIIRSEVVHDTPVNDHFNEAVLREGGEQVIALRGQRLDLGGGVFVEILFPDRAVSALESNDASIITRIVYGETSFLLTGDASEKIEEYLIQLDGELLQSIVLKAGHHGSKTSSSEPFIGYVSPTYVVMSRGCNNRYGHPHEDIVDRFEAHGVQIMDTCQEGRVTFVSDGYTVSTK